MATLAMPRPFPPSRAPLLLPGWEGTAKPNQQLLSG